MGFGGSLLFGEHPERLFWLVSMTIETDERNPKASWPARHQVKECQMSRVDWLLHVGDDKQTFLGGWDTCGWQTSKKGNALLQRYRCICKVTDPKPHGTKKGPLHQLFHTCKRFKLAIRQQHEQEEKARKQTPVAEVQTTKRFSSKPPKAPRPPRGLKASVPRSARATPPPRWSCSPQASRTRNTRITRMAARHPSQAPFRNLGNESIPRQMPTRPTVFLTADGCEVAKSRLQGARA